MSTKKSEGKILLSVDGIIHGNYSETEHCACCHGKHRYSTTQQWGWNDDFLKYITPYKNVDSAIEKIIRTLPDGSRLRLTIELIEN